MGLKDYMLQKFEQIENYMSRIWNSHVTNSSYLIFIAQVKIMQHYYFKADMKMKYFVLKDM